MYTKNAYDILPHSGVDGTSFCRLMNKMRTRVHKNCNLIKKTAYIIIILNFL